MVLERIMGRRKLFSQGRGPYQGKSIEIHNSYIEIFSKGGERDPIGIIYYSKITGCRIAPSALRATISAYMLYGHLAMTSKKEYLVRSTLDDGAEVIMVGG